MVPVDFPEGKVIPWTLVDEDDAEGGDDDPCDVANVNLRRAAGFSIATAGILVTR